MVMPRSSTGRCLLILLLITLHLAPTMADIPPPAYSEHDVGSESVTEHSSWTDQMKQSLAGMAVGILLLCVSFPFLFWNEGRAVVRSAVIDLGSKAVVELEAPMVNPENNGALIAIAGPVTAADPNTFDPTFQICAPVGALKLRRGVQMYQWKEKKKDKQDSIGGGGATKKTHEKTRAAPRVGPPHL
eukprot:TRINITY_DN21164_c0_g2_i1.p1 TRINITY_DN21164_c0_g2~~TRINITY_DN21164_c0_g2_i1.p1  ORF type:complete len:187 (-),score=32.36 TRINITY_DN21164_c0_g2_i1:128-688(-)